MGISENEKINNDKSYFNGDTLSNIFYTVLALIIRVATLDILAPVVICLRLKWKAEHTYINGRRMVFIGQISDLFVKNIIWVLLSIVTLGIFVPFKLLKTAQWETENLHFIGVPPHNYGDERSDFKCKWYVYFGVSILKFLGTIFTFGIAHIWLYIYKEKVLTQYKYIDGHQLQFNATASGYFAKRFYWLLLSVITLGIYGLLLKGKLLRWCIAYTSVQNPHTIRYCEDTAAEQNIQPINTAAYINFFLLLLTVLFLVCAFSSRVLCSQGIINALIIVPFVFCIAAMLLSVVMLTLSVKAYRFSLKTKTKCLTIILFVFDILAIIISVALFVYIIILVV